MTTSPSRSRIAATGGFLRRLGTSWRALEPEQRTAGAAAMALFVTMFLPWYSQTVVGATSPGSRPSLGDKSITAFGAFSFVEAAVLLVAVGILWLLSARGEGKAFHLPGGDGNVIFAAGLWVCLLVFYRQFDKPSPTAGKDVAVTVGVSWGIFVTFLTGLFIAFSGQRLRAAHLAEPPLPGDVAPSDAVRARDDRRARPEPDASQTVVDRRGPSVDETLIADVPEFPPATGPSPPRPAGDGD